MKKNEYSLVSVGAAVWRVLPLSWFFGPVFDKEVRVAGRKLGTYVTRGLMGGLLFLVVGIAWLGQAPTEITTTGVERVQQSQQVAPQVATAVAWTLFIVLVVFAPTLTATRICEERRSRTLSALLTTPLSPARIILGTLAGRCVQLFVLALLAMPLLLALRVLGGVPAGTIGAMFAVTLSAAILGASFGLLMSTVQKRPVRAIGFSVVCLLTVQIAPAVVLYYLITQYRVQSVPFEAVVVIGSPFAMGVLTADLWGGMAGGPFADMNLKLAVALNIAFNLVFSGVLLAGAVACLRRVMRNEGGGEAPAPPARRVKPRRAALPDAASALPRAPQALQLPGAPQALPPESDRSEVMAEISRDVPDHPVFWREVRQGLFSRTWHAWLITGIVLALIAWLFLANGFDTQTSHMLIHVLGTVALVVTAALSTVGGVTTEREVKSWDVLLMTTLPPWRIVLGKLAGAVRKQWFGPLILLTTLLVAGVATGSIQFVSVAHLALIQAGTIAMLAGTGTLLSMVCRRTTPAAIMNLGIALGLWLALPLGVAMAGSLLSSRYGDDGWVQNVVNSLNPVLLAGTAIEGAWLVDGESPFLGQTYDIPGGIGNLDLWGFSGWVLVYATLSTAVGAASVALAIVGFSRITGRTS